MSLCLAMPLPSVCVCVHEEWVLLLSFLGRREVGKRGTFAEISVLAAGGNIKFK